MFRQLANIKLTDYNQYKRIDKEANIMKVITLLNEKGGVGKTTLAGTLGVGLAKKGNNVLMIDADGQGNLSSWFQLPKKGRFYDMCRRDNEDAPWENLVMKPPQDVVGEVSGNLWVVIGNEESNAITSGIHLNQLGLQIKKRLNAVKNMFDYVIFDTQPSPTMLHDAIASVTDHLIFPTQPEAFSSWEGLADSIYHTQEVRKQAAQAGLDIANILAIIPNQYRGTAQHNLFLDDLREQYGDLVTEPIPLYTAISEQQLTKRFLITDELAPGKAKAMLQTFVDDICTRLGVKV